MKISYLDETRLYYAFMAGGNKVIKDQKYLNKINVFPGHGARGNSGIIFAQFLYGISKEIKNAKRISTISFGKIAKKAVQYAYRSVVSPVEGTMLTVMKDWAEAVCQQRIKKQDFVDLLSYSLQVTKESLIETRYKLPVLAKAGVVDAGAKGFVDFLEGITNFIKKGNLKKIPKSTALWEDEGFHVHKNKDAIEQRLCTEALFVGKGMDLNKFREEIIPFGKSFSRKGNIKKIMQPIKERADKEKLWNYAIVHAQNRERAEMYAEQIQGSTHRKPAYIMDISPVIGVHNGTGAVGIALMLGS